MTAEELVARLEARGITFRPVHHGTALGVRPADAAAPEELAALAAVKSEVLDVLQRRLDESLGDLREDFEERAAIMEHDGRLPRSEAERRARAIFPWPLSLGGAPRTLGSLGSCARCSADAHPAQRSTWVRYQEPLCLRHALKAEVTERRPA